MRTTQREVVEKIQDHILESFSKDNGWDHEDPKRNVENQIKYMQRDGETVYKTARNYVEGGAMLVYYGDVIDWLKTLNLDESRQYSEQESWELYVHLLAREITKMVEA